MKAKFRKVGIIALGWLLIVAGLVLALPLVPGPGSLVILMGLWVLSCEQHWARRLIERIEKRFPRFATLMHEARVKARDTVRRWFGREPQPDPAKRTCPTDVREPVSQ